MLRILLFFAWAVLASRLGLAAEPDVELYSQAAKAFNDKFYERAEQQFGEFVAKYPASTNASSAILYRAQARFFQRRYEAAVELLRGSLDKAGDLGPDFTFWTGEALSELGNYAGAAESYRKVATDYPKSPLALKASYLEAFCAFQLKEYVRAIELLQNPGGAFKTFEKEKPADPVALRGELLLGDSLIAANKADEARAVLAALNPPAEQPELLWEKYHLLARIEFTSATPEAALPNVTNAVAAARSAKKPMLEAQTRNLEADLYRKLNRQNDAVTAYETIGAIDGLPRDQKRLALLKTVELLSTAGNITNALIRLEHYLGAVTNEPAADLLRIKAGELWIEHFRQLAAGAARPPASATNALEQGRTHLTTVLNLFTNSTHLGRAWLNLGWTFWEEGLAYRRPARIQQSEDAFRAAAEKLIRSDDQALAFFKIADAQLFLGQPELARSNYVAVARNYTDLPQVRNALLDKAYRQLVRTSIELKDFGAAKQFLEEFRAAFPNSPLIEETLFLYGKALARAGDANGARAVFQDFLRTFPGAALAPEVRFAEARTYSGEGDFATSLKKHEEWLRAYTNNALRAEVEFRRATLLDKIGPRTNALVAFTNFVSRFGSSPLAPAAQTWVADYYYELEQWPSAEQNYQRIFQNTNWIGTPLAYEARLMAAKTAFKRQGYSDARSYLTNLINNLSSDAKAPPNLLAEAYFVLGDVFLEEPISASTNSFHNFIEAAKAFDQVATQYPSNKLAVLALGKKGDCHLQLASSPAYAQSFSDATNAYLAVLHSKLPDVPVAARNQAQIGLGLALKGLADTKTNGERQALLEAALNRFLDVVYGSDRGEPPDPYFLKVAGLEAGRLAEALGNSGAALQLYRRLQVEAPSLKSFWEARINSLQGRIAAITAP